MNTDERLDRLERENRRLKAVVGLLAAMVGTAAILGMAALACARGRSPSESEVLRASRIEIVNDKGAAVVVAQADGAGRGRIVTYDTAGRQFVQIASTDDGGTVAVAGKGGKLRAGLGVAQNDAGNFFSYDTNGNRLIAIGTMGSGDGAVFSYLRNGELKAMWP